MRKTIDIKTNGQCTSVRFPELGTGDVPRTAVFANAFWKGKKHSSAYTSEELLTMLRTGTIEKVNEAFGAISQRKLKEALDTLRQIAFYDEDLVIQREAVRTVRRIGGKTATKILRDLRSTEQGQFAEEILKAKDPDEVLDE